MLLQPYRLEFITKTQKLTVALFPGTTDFQVARVHKLAEEAK